MNEKKWRKEFVAIQLLARHRGFEDALEKLNDIESELIADGQDNPNLSEIQERVLENRLEILAANDRPLLEHLEALYAAFEFEPPDPMRRLETIKMSMAHLLKAVRNLQ